MTCIVGSCIGKSNRINIWFCLLKFIKIFREFHYGPDEADNKEKENHNHQHIDQKKPTSPPESTFKKLQPSKQRYTILSPRDEL